MDYEFDRIFNFDMVTYTTIYIYIYRERERERERERGGERDHTYGSP